MEQVGEEVVANNIADKVEFHGKDCNLAMKLEGQQNMLGSPIVHPSMRCGNWSESSSHYFPDVNEAGVKDLSRFVISSAGSESLHARPCFITDTGSAVVEELVVGDCKNPHVATARSPESNKRILSRNALNNNFSQLLMNRAAKGKSVTRKNQASGADFGSTVVGTIDENLGYARRVASDALMRSSVNHNQLPLGRNDRSSHESLHGGISLREWLKPGCQRKQKFESLFIFRQIVKLVDSAHSQGVVLQELRPSFFNLLPLNRIIYTGSSAQSELKHATFHDLFKKRLLKHDMGTHYGRVLKQQRLDEDITHHMQPFQCTSTGWNESECIELPAPNHFDCQSSRLTTRQQFISLTVQLEQKWYKSPELLNEGHSTFSSNIYSLGVLLFELFSWFESLEVHSAAMTDLCHRILPPNFLSKNPHEAGFCLWLIHPEPSSRPTTREILQSELISLEIGNGNDMTAPDNVDVESDVLLHFLNLLHEQRQKHATKLVGDIKCIEEDVKEVEKLHLLRTSNVFPQTRDKFLDVREQNLHLDTSLNDVSITFPLLTTDKARLVTIIQKIEEAYFSMRSQIQLTSAPRNDKDLLNNRDRFSAVCDENEGSNLNRKSDYPVGVFFEGLCKFARYTKFEVCGLLKNGDLMRNTNVICSLSFDRDEDFIATAGVSKKIKVFEFGALLNDSIDIHYPVVEMPNKSKVSCICWNNYIKNYLASTDYNGVVQIWDAGTGQGFSHYTEHQNRAWSVDFSRTDPMMFASGSDDCSVKVWSINEKNSIGTIWSPANVCCVGFSASSTHLLVFGSADYKLYCYDLRHTRIPWCTLAGHEKAVSYMQFLDSETLVSASTDNTLKLWDLTKTSSTGLSFTACNLTFRGHTNEKNFVGLSALDGYIACGSETNEVYSYYRSLPMPITSHKFGYVDPISGNEMGDDSGQFVSSVCWRQKSSMVVAANSSGNMKVLRMV